MISLEAIPSILSAVAAFVLAALVGSRGRQRVAKLAFVGGMIGLGAGELGRAVLLILDSTPARVLLSQTAVGAQLAVMPLWALFSVTFAEADEMAEFRRWRWVLGLVGLAALALLVMAGWQPFAFSAYPDPFGIRVLVLSPVGKGAAVVSLLTAVFVLFHLESTLRTSTGLTRWTIKYFVLGLLGLFGAQIFVLSQRLLYGVFLFDHLLAQSTLFLLCFGLMGFCLVRHRLLEVDVFVSRHVVYRSVAIGAVGIYLLGLGLTGELGRRFGVSLDFFFMTLLVFVSAITLMVGLLSETVRRRVKRAITTHFYRHKYDYRREWSEFTAKVASVGHLDVIASRILERVTETMGIRQGAIWLVEEQRTWKYAASTGLPPEGRSLSIDPATLLARATRDGKAVILLEGTVFPGNGGNSPWNRELRVLVPLIAKGEVVGLLALESPAGGRLTLEDEDLLATVAAQAATAILNARLSEQLARSREMEAFHRLSSFVLHDLKNCVAMLSLVTHNAEIHEGDPAFRQDAFRTVGESVRQMRELIGRLSGLPKQLELAPRPTDLNLVVREVVTSCLGATNGRVRIHVELDDAAVAVFAGDEAIRTVVSNLVLNAAEALPGEGEVRVKTSRQGASALLIVADTGRGMSEAFLRESLFVPFRTTKPHGLGIGLYQVKSIVEALGGRIRVESHEGLGTTIRVELPAGSGIHQGSTPPPHHHSLPSVREQGAGR